MKVYHSSAPSFVLTEVCSVATYLDIDVFKIFPLLCHVLHSWRIILILDICHAPFRHIHAEARLDLNYDEDVLGSVMFTVKIGTLWV
jgi:hypothetical protein